MVATPRDLLFPSPFTLHIVVALLVSLNTKGKISSVGTALDCRAGGRGFDSRGQTNTQGLKIT